MNYTGKKFFVNDDPYRTLYTVTRDTEKDMYIKHDNHKPYWGVS